MPLLHSEKENIISSAATALKGARMVIFADFKGISVKKSQVFRRKVKKEGGDFRIIKKTLARIALKNAGLSQEGLENYKDTLAIAAHPTQDSAFAKLFTQSTKEFPELKIVAGIFDGQNMSRAEVMELAKLPSREELLSRLVGTLIAPVSGFVRVLNGPLTGFTNIINSLATK
ncbi:MAG: 50S ribosomal protein L10 [bacterium]|nr:50S ribosomal protein L10 [bacterium]